MENSKKFIILEDYEFSDGVKLRKGTRINVTPKEEGRCYYLVDIYKKIRLIPKSILNEVSSFNETNLPESEHYHTGKIDVWTYGEENFSLDEVTGFHRMNVLKYVSRYGKKGGYNRTDLEKAKAYIEKLIELHDRYRVGDE